MSTNIRVEKICHYCEKMFIAKTLVTKYCSHKCNSKAYKVRKKFEKLGGSNESKKVSTVLPKPIETFLGTIQEKQFLTVPEVAKLLHLSERTIYNLIKDGKLNASRLSERTTRVRRTEIDKLFTH